MVLALKTGHTNCELVSSFFNSCGCSFLDFIRNENGCNLNIDDEIKLALADFYSGQPDKLRR